MSRTFGALLLLFTVAAVSASAKISYDDPAYAGNQGFTGNLGLDFNVNAPIVVTSLGAFNANGAAGFAGTISVGIFNRTTTAQVGPTVTLSGTNGILVDGDRFLAVTPFLLPPGNYSVVAVGFSGADQNGNSTFGGFQASTEDTGGGLISFVGSGRFDNSPTLDYPTTVVPGLPSNVFNAGTFQFHAEEAPTFIKSFDVNVITVGQTTRLGFAIVNNPGNTALTGLAFSDTLPGDLLVAPGTVLNTCGGTLTAVPGTNSVSYTGGSIAAGLVTCNVIIHVTPVAPVSAATSLTNTTSTLTLNEAPPSNPASANIVVLPADAAQVSYSANLKSGDSKINLTNAGTTGGIDATDSICVNVYVFAEDQQLIECCTCPLTPNDLRTLSVTNDLINNTLTPGVPVGITTMLVAVAGKRCDAANVLPTDLVAGLRAWGTTLHAAPAGGFAVTETPFSDVALSPTELAKMTQFCGFIEADGSKFGVCNSCSSGAAGASKK